MSFNESNFCINTQYNLQSDLEALKRVSTEDELNHIQQTAQTIVQYLHAETSRYHKGEIIDLSYLCSSDIDSEIPNDCAEHDDYHIASDSQSYKIIDVLTRQCKTPVYSTCFISNRDRNNIWPTSILTTNDIMKVIIERITRSDEIITISSHLSSALYTELDERIISYALPSVHTLTRCKDLPFLRVHVTDRSEFAIYRIIEKLCNIWKSSYLLTVPRFWDLIEIGLKHRTHNLRLTQSYGLSRWIQENFLHDIVTRDLNRIEYLFMIMQATGIDHYVEIIHQHSLDEIGSRDARRNRRSIRRRNASSASRPYHLSEVMYKYMKLDQPRSSVDYFDRLFVYHASKLEMQNIFNRLIMLRLYAVGAKTKWMSFSEDQSIFFTTLYASIDSLNLICEKLFQRISTMQGVQDWNIAERNPDLFDYRMLLSDARHPKWITLPAIVEQINTVARSLI